MFASDPDYISFALSATEQLKLQGLINFVMKKACGHLSAGVLSQNFWETFKWFIRNDKGYHFMSTIKGTPAYWKDFLASSCNGHAPRSSNFLYDINLCWFSLEWIDFNHCQVERGKYGGRRYLQHRIFLAL